jgi:CBS domain-containing protein
MTVDDVMTPEPVCCTPETGLREVSLMMLEHDCGEIPIVQNADERTLVGVVTDRDIVCRLVAHGQNPVELTAEACMSHPVVSVAAGSSLDECCELMGTRQIRRMPVVDANGAICGIVSQADIAQFTSIGRTAEVVREVSEPARTAGQWPEPEPPGAPVPSRRAPGGDRYAG